MIRNTNSLADVLVRLGFETGWATANDEITLWENDEPQPTEEELLAAGWVKSSDFGYNADPQHPA